MAHGTSSEQDAEAIQAEGFRAQEGRATVSGDLIYAFEWAVNQDKRKGSKSEADISADEMGRIVIMQVPENKAVDYATHTNIDVDNNQGEITGYADKYVSGRKQLAIYHAGEIATKRKEIEQAKKELKIVNNELVEFLQQYNIDRNNIKSKDDLLSAIEDKSIDDKIAILKQVEIWEERQTTLRQQSELPIDIDKDNIAMSLVPSPELGQQLSELSDRIKALQVVDLEQFTASITDIITSNKDNFLAAGVDVRAVVNNLLATTIEAEVVNMVRSLALDVKRAKGFTVYDRDGDESKDKTVDIDELKHKLQRIKAVVDGKGNKLGNEKINRYLQLSVGRLLAELD